MHLMRVTGHALRMIVALSCEKSFAVSERVQTPREKGETARWTAHSFLSKFKDKLRMHCQRIITHD